MNSTSFVCSLCVSCVVKKKGTHTPPLSENKTLLKELLTLYRIGTSLPSLFIAPFSPILFFLRNP